MLAGVEVNGGDAAIRRLDQRQPSRAEDVLVVASRKRRMSLRVIYPMQLHGGDGHVRRHVEHTRARIRCASGPVGTAPLPGHHQNPLLGRRRVERAVVVAGEDLLGFLAQFGREVNQVVLANALALKRRRFGRKGLGRRGLLARHLRLGHRPFDNRPDRLAAFAVKHKAEGLFGQHGKRSGAGDRPLPHPATPEGLVDRSPTGRDGLADSARPARRSRHSGRQSTR